ncbi:unnamed protein product [Gordionus sp. m RMFG-2023]|uniref:thioredoxin, mitochondrial-like isoform X1 n=1 Tax=Gordionus sp. m RMFG-2023 TaxID=3053472 RepID=UPI0030E371C8
MQNFVKLAAKAKSFNFEKRIIKSDNPVLVDFYADWCGPCKILTPRLEKEISKNSKNISLAKINVDNLTDLADKYEISGLPTVMAFKNGKEVDKFMGVKEEDFIRSFIKKIIDGPL